MHGSNTTGGSRSVHVGQISTALHAHARFRCLTKCCVRCLGALDRTDRYHTQLPKPHTYT
jgi:hypothetical protein